MGIMTKKMMATLMLAILFLILFLVLHFCVAPSFEVLSGGTWVLVRYRPLGTAVMVINYGDRICINHGLYVLYLLSESRPFILVLALLLIVDATLSYVYSRRSSVAGES